MIDYEILRLIWWALLGILLIGFVVLDGFDLGVAMLLPFLGRNDQERRLMINTVGPVWEGNQVWLILGAGASFAAWPPVYAVSFSAFYFAMFLALFAIILRPVGFKFRSKMPGERWRHFWDWCLFTGGVVPAFIFGVAFGNLFLGIPFHFDEFLRSTYTGSFWALLTPFPVLCGILCIALMLLQGSAFLSLKTTGQIAHRAKNVVNYAALSLLLLFGLAGLWLYVGIQGVTISTEIDVRGPSNLINKSVIIEAGAWFKNYFAYPVTVTCPAIAFASLLITVLCNSFKKAGLTFISSCLSVISIIATGGIALFPFLLPSSTHPNHSLTVWDASGSQMTLYIMLLSVLIFLPFVLVYTAWVYRVLRGPVTAQDIEENKTNAY